MTYILFIVLNVSTNPILIEHNSKDGCLKTALEFYSINKKTDNDSKVVVIKAECIKKHK